MTDLPAGFRAWWMSVPEDLRIAWGASAISAAAAAFAAGIAQASERPDCNTCDNRGRVDGLSQESHCDHCIRDVYIKVVITHYGVKMTYYPEKHCRSTVGGHHTLPLSFLQ